MLRIRWPFELCPSLAAYDGRHCLYTPVDTERSIVPAPRTFARLDCFLKRLYKSSPNVSSERRRNCCAVPLELQFAPCEAERPHSRVGTHSAASSGAVTSLAERRSRSEVRATLWTVPTEPGIGRDVSAIGGGDEINRPTHHPALHGGQHRHPGFLQTRKRPLEVHHVVTKCRPVPTYLVWFAAAGTRGKYQQVHAG